MKQTRQAIRAIKQSIFLDVYALVTPEAGLLNKSSCSAPTSGVTKCIAVIVMNRSHFVVLLKSDLGVKQTRL
jgi:hypothetical protein